MNRLILLLVTLTAITCIFAVPVWENPVPIRTGDIVEWNRCGASTSDGCMIYVWSGTKNGDRDIFAQKVSATGLILWQQPVTIVNKAARQIDPVITQTTDNNYIIAWFDYTNEYEACISAQKITSAGQLLWSPEGIPISISPDYLTGLDIAPNNNGGAYIVWSKLFNFHYGLCGQQIDAYGNALWQVDGLTLVPETAEVYYFSISSDNSSGIVLGYQGYIDNRPAIITKRILSSGQSAWSQPLLISNLAYCLDNIIQFVAVDDSSYIITYSGSVIDPGDPKIFAQRFSNAGIVLWASPVVVCASPSQMQLFDKENPRLIKSGDNSVIIVWEDKRNSSQYPDLYAQKVSYTGNLLWNTGALPVCTAAYGQNNHRLAADNAGGCFIVWEDCRNGDTPNNDIYLQHLNTNGIPQFIDNGIAICSSDYYQYYPLLKLINDKVFICWGDYRSGLVGIYYQVLNLSGEEVLAYNGKLIYHGLGGEMQNLDYQIFARSNDAAIIWTDNRNSNIGYKLFIQFLNTDGSVDLEANGRPVTISTEYNQREFSSVVTPDDKIAIVWTENNENIKAQLFDANGNRLWGDDGMYITDYLAVTQNNPKISFADGAFYIGWSQYSYVNTTQGSRGLYRVFGQKIVDNLRQWDPDGVLISDWSSIDGGLTDIHLDSIIGNYYVWSQFNVSLENFGSQFIYAKLVDSAGSAAIGWPEAGLNICDFYEQYNRQYLPECLLTNAGLFITWLDLRTDYVNSAYGQLISSQGIKLWNPEGVALTNPASEDSYIRLMLNNNQITVFTTESLTGVTSTIRMQKYTYAGVPLFEDSGIAVNTNPLPSHYTETCPTLFDNGGILVSWNNYTVDEHNNYSDNDVFYRFINPDGSLIGNGAASLHSTTDQQYKASSVAIGNDAYIIWADYNFTRCEDRCGDEIYDYYSLYAQKLSNEYTSTEDDYDSPALMNLAQNYPNPFNPVTNINFTLKTVSDATLTIYNQKGQKVKTLCSGTLDKGKHDFIWNGKDDNDKPVSSGVYIYMLSNGNTHQTKKMVLLK